VARVIDVGAMDNGAPYMVMEYLDGEDLDQRLARDGRVPVTEALRLVLQACEALAEAHAAGIVHRDLKPANLFLARQKDRRILVKVLDFGISKMEEPGQTNLTKTSTMVGTPYYMSQEQLTNSKAVDVRADIWSLGVILYELMTGHRPFTAETMPEIVGAILQNTPDRPSELEPSISVELEEVIFKCLRSKVADRYQSVAELAHALSPFLDDDAKPSVAVISRVLGAPSIPPPQTVAHAGSTLADGSGPRLLGAGPDAGPGAPRRPGCANLRGPTRTTHPRPTHSPFTGSSRIASIRSASASAVALMLNCNLVLLT
jgi:serine/threonine-protein kinase